eukprot:TRINITY_DN27016_c1_g1_i1.p1 TRINITY_DN27016_c1_g1~~TRINITY_DN27016_c1_g1_i1.p1  ORF type:complete len:489 (+),score=83.97 TRINITY_DN27016_c1_g1_i1:81-1469(+)
MGETAGIVSLLVLEIVSIIFVCISVVNSTFLLCWHMRANKNEQLRRYTVRILLMVPLYSLTCCLNLWLHGYDWLSKAFEMARMLWESVVIFSFLQYILACAGGIERLLDRFAHPFSQRLDQADDGATSEELEETVVSQELGQPAKRGSSAVLEDVGADEHEGVASDTSISADSGCSNESSDEGSDDSLQGERRTVKHLPILACCLPPWRSAGQMLRWSVRCTLSYCVMGIIYVLVRVVCAIHFAVNHRALPGAGTISIIAKILLMMSQGAALTGMTTLAINMLQELEPLRPHAKFLSVKLVIFFTFWQEILLQGLCAWGVLEPLVTVTHNMETSHDVSKSLQNFLICIEMAVVSVYHFRVWPAHDFLQVEAHLLLRGRCERTPASGGRQQLSSDDPDEELEVADDDEQDEPEFARTQGPRTRRRHKAADVLNFADILATVATVHLFTRGRTFSTNSPRWHTA